MTPEHETAHAVAEHLRFVYVPGVGAYRQDGTLVYMDDDSFLMTEEQEQKARNWREQHRVAPSALTRESIRSPSKLMWRDAGTNVMRFVFFGNRSVQDTHLPRNAVGAIRRLWEWKEARRDMDRERKPGLAQLADNT